MKTRLSSALAFALLACGAPPTAPIGAETSSGGEDAARSEAVAATSMDEAEELLRRLSAIDIEAPREAREAALAHVRELELHDPETIEVRRLCVEGHAHMLQAAQLTAVAGDRLAAAEAIGEVPPAEREAILAIVAESDRHIAAARASMASCQVGTVGLENRLSAAGR